LAFAIWLGELEIAGRRYEVMLPSEAQWEYACRAGSNKPFSIVGMDGDSITADHCNFDGNYPWPQNKDNHDQAGVYLERTIPVDGRSEDGRLLGHNSWGFSQLHGNVWEWAYDWYASDYYSACEKMRESLDPLGPNNESVRVVRGGSWYDRGRHCRSSYRFGSVPSFRYRYCGFRLSAVPFEPSIARSKIPERR
jgi:formylglycine-generating enzyme